MLKFILLLSLILFSKVSAIELNYIDTKYEKFTLSYIVDKDSSYTIDSVQNMELKKINNRHTFKGYTGDVWYKLELLNTTKLDKDIFIHDYLAYFSKEIIIYEFVNNRLLDQNRYDTLSNKSSNKLFGSTLVYEMTIKANSKSVLFIRNTPMVSNLFDLNVYEKKSSITSLINHPFYSIVIISIMLALALYNLSLYFFNKRIEFMLYAIYMINPAIGLMYKYGIIFNYFNLYGENTYWFNLTAILLGLFLILFLKQALNTKEMDKKINYMLNSIGILIALNVIIAFAVDLTFAIEIFKVIFFYTVFVMVYLAYYLFKISHPLAKIFTLAYGAYFTGMIITILAMSNTIELNFFTFHSGGIGLIIEGLLFSYLMHYNIKILEQKIQYQKEIIITKNKKAQLGDMISAITHQWKQPLSRVTSITSLLEFKIIKKTEISSEELSEKISLINSNIIFLSETIDDFKDFFNPNAVASECDIELVVKRAIEFSQDDTMTKEISLNTDLNFTKHIKIYKNELLHIILNIIQNSKEAFKNTHTDIKLIKIIGYTKDEKTYIDIIDNAGGIDKENLPFIFNEHYTTKEKKTGSGLGLYLTKIILENHLKGSIEVKNIGDGAMFRIIL